MSFSNTANCSRCKKTETISVESESETPFSDKGWCGIEGCVICYDCRDDLRAFLNGRKLAPIEEAQLDDFHESRLLSVSADGEQVHVEYEDEQIFIWTEKEQLIKESNNFPYSVLTEDDLSKLTAACSRLLGVEAFLCKNRPAKTYPNQCDHIAIRMLAGERVCGSCYIELKNLRAAKEEES